MLITPLFIWLAGYTLLSAVQQGIIVWLFREYVPPGRLDWINAALHAGGLLLYGLVAAALGGWQWPALVAAALVRLIVFDPALNLTRSYFNYREGRPMEPVFSVGFSASTDKALRWLAPANPNRLRFLLWLTAILAAAGFYFTRL